MKTSQSGEGNKKHIREDQKIPKRLIFKQFAPRHIKIKFSKVKEKIFLAREKSYITYKRAT